MTRTALETLNNAIADANNTVATFNYWDGENNEAWAFYDVAMCDDYDMDDADDYEDAPVEEGIYTCNGKSYVATSLEEAYLMALNEFGVEAIGKGVQCEGKNDFLIGVCLDAYREAFPTFTDADFLAHVIAMTYAWVNFDKVKGYDYWEERETIALNEEGLNYIRNNSRLFVHMEATGFVW